MASHFVYKLIPPRPTFAADMTDSERAAMGEHSLYWTRLFEEGRVVAFGAVLDPAGVWGLALVEAENAEEVRAIAAGDPAVRTDVCTFTIAPMPQALVRPDIRRRAGQSG